MVKQSSTAEIIFSLDQANAMLPLLRLIVADISLAHRELSERRHQLHRLVRRREDSKAQLYNDEVEDTRNDLRNETRQLDEYITELEGLGVVLRSAYDGIVDFPTVIRDEAAFYIWKMGELDVGFWRWPSETFSQRRPLPKERV
ncbi:MAG: DUF2203 domain-containing protein [Planctomycetota bacterium]|jgi:hypothetical protein|nr:DUF2203 domain-containing protein [Planctomycetota bacterium]